jgi:hypothetical protein
MLQLTTLLTKEVLSLLNQPDYSKQLDLILKGEAHQHHLALEETHYDTSYSQFHRELGQWIDGVLKAVKSKATLGSDEAGYWLLGRWYTCVDVFSISELDQISHPWITNHATPLIAARVANTLFYQAGDSPWKARSWRGEGDPLLTLPYQRKYDFERHGRADLLLKNCYQSLGVASDILSLLSERIDDAEVCPTFLIPPILDLQDELAKLKLTLGLDTLASLAGRFGLELLTFEGQMESSRLEIIETGNYKGVLGGYHRRKSGSLRPALSPSSEKWIFQCALQELQSKLQQILD